MAMSYRSVAVDMSIVSPVPAAVFMVLLIFSDKPTVTLVLYFLHLSWDGMSLFSQFWPYSDSLVVAVILT